MSLSGAFESALIKFRDYVVEQCPDAYEVRISFRSGGVIEYTIVRKGCGRFVHLSDASSSEESV